MASSLYLVTGASGGIGAAIVRTLIENGATVFGLDRAPGGFSNERYHFLETDLTSPESVGRAYAAVAEKTDRLDGIVNAAGIVFMGSTVEEDPEFMQKILDVNVAATARINRVFFPLVERAKGRYVNFSSEYGTYCSIPFHGFYTASKHAVERYTDALRRELAYLGMKACVIRPGAVNTPMTAGTVPAFDNLLETTTHYEKTYRKLYPLMANATKHPIPPERVANTVLRALTAKRPKRAYNVHRDGRVLLLSHLPAPLVDFIFRRFF